MKSKKNWKREDFLLFPILALFLSLILVIALPCSWALADETPPSAPSNLTAVQGAGTSINLSWDAATDPESGIDHYIVYRYSEAINAGNKSLASILSNSVTGTGYTDSIGIPGETYYYAVSAVNGENMEGDLSNSPSQTVPTGPNPHESYSDLSNFCRDCHRTHGVPSGAKIILRKEPEIDVCYVCHDGTGSVYNIQTTYQGLAAHDTQISAPSISDLKCMNCHYPHGTGYDLMTRLSEENLCLNDGCHDNTAHDRTTTILNWNIYNQFQMASRHAITGTTGDGLTGAKVECSSCHGPHTVKYSSTALEKISDPDNTYKLANASGTGISEMTDFCLKCHDGTGPTQTLGNETTFVPYTIAFPDVSSYPFFTGWSKSTFKTKIHYTTTGTKAYCNTCHHPHGSENARLTGYDYDNSSTYNEENLCYECHGAVPGTTLFEDDFESGNLTAKNWTVVNDGGFVGAANTEAHGGNWCVKYYGNDLSTDTKSITTPNIDVTSYTTLTLTYWHRIEDLEAGDEAHLDIYDGSWHTDVKGPYLDDNGQHSTSSGDYIKETVDLSSYSKVSDFKIRFRCTARDSEGSDTWLLDDVLFTGSTGSGSGADDIESAFDKGFKHPVETYSGRHSDTETASDFGSSNRHAECVDCHDVHNAEEGNHTQESSVAGNSLIGAIGVKPTTWPNDGDYTAPGFSFPSAPSSWTTVLLNGDADDYEAYLCFKCHTNYATGYPTSGYTNLALEFNPNNPSYHGVLGQTTAGQYGTYVNGWDYQAKMTCSDCHASEYDSDPRGPHGSTNEHILRAPYDASTGVQGHSDSGDLCFKCHSYNAYGQNAQESTNSGFEESGQSSRKNLHYKSDHAEEGCYKCHSTIPHGYFHRALNIDKDEATPYNGSGGFGMNVTTWPSSQRQWNKSYCQGTTCGNH